MTKPLAACYTIGNRVRQAYQRCLLRRANEKGVLSGALVFFLLDSKIIYENRLTFVKFCGILELPLESLSSFPLIYTSKSRRYAYTADYEERKSVARRKHIRRANVCASPQFFSNSISRRTVLKVSKNFPFASKTDKFVELRRQQNTAGKVFVLPPLKMVDYQKTKRIGVSPSGKATHFDCVIQVFKSLCPCQ